VNTCLSLCETLVEYRHLPIYAQLYTIGQKHSMLHCDVLALLHYFAPGVNGGILEIGPYVGGSTIALALGVMSGGRPVQLTTVECGGAHPTHPTLPSDDILRDLKRNLLKRGVADAVTVVEGPSSDARVVQRLHELHPIGSVDLLVIDADGNVGRDLRKLGRLLRDDCLLVVDDYYAPNSEKMPQTRQHIDALVDAGRARPLGVFGWGTWFGRLTPVSPAAT
jgi:predicted O-methyltransferase YrrM